MKVALLFAGGIAIIFAGLLIRSQLEKRKTEAFVEQTQQELRVFRASVAPQIAEMKSKIEAIDLLAKRLPEAQAKLPGLAGKPPVDLTSTEGNADMIELDSQRRRRDTSEMLDGNVIVDTLRQSEVSYQDKNALRLKIKRAMGVRYVVLVETSEIVQPTTEASRGSQGEHQFLPGRWRGVAYVADLTTNEFLARVGASAVSSESVNFKMTKDKAGYVKQDNSQASLKTDFRNNVNAALKASLAKAAGAIR